MSLPEYIPYRRKRNWWLPSLIAIGVVIFAGFLLWQIPTINRAISWRWDIVITYARALIRPVSKLPTPMVVTQSAAVPLEPTRTAIPITPTGTPQFTPTSTPIPTPLPSNVALNPPPYDEAKDKQDWNNCGPATLALYLRFYGWDGNQYDVSNVIKPSREDRNVNVEELVYYVRTQAGWLNAEYRVGGNLETIRKFIANGIPIMIEETFRNDQIYWQGDDQWSGHYLLITGYDDSLRQFTSQDSYTGPDQKLDYQMLDKNWQSFNRVYILVFRPEQQGLVNELLGADRDVDVNRQNALNVAELETQRNPSNAFAWFNVGTNLTYFERFYEAAQAYDQARTLVLPERMLRYQFGPFMAYFHSGRIEELMALTEYALVITRVTEEAMLWRGYGFYRLGDKSAAISLFRSALKIRPGYEDALRAIDFVSNN